VGVEKRHFILMPSILYNNKSAVHWHAQRLAGDDGKWADERADQDEDDNVHVAVMGGDEKDQDYGGE